MRLRLLLLLRLCQLLVRKVYTNIHSMQCEHGRVGRKSKGDVHDKLLAKDVQDFLTVRMALHKKVDRSSVTGRSLRFG
jgi:hypothetical protein